MQTALPEPTGEPEIRTTARCPTHPPRPTQRGQHRHLRLLHLMALVAAVALTFLITPTPMKLIAEPSTNLFWDEWLFYQISLTLTFWTPILALIAAIGNRFRFRRASRSYGTAAVFAAAAAIIVLLVKRLIGAFPGSPRGVSLSVLRPDFSPAARRLVADAPEGATAAIVAVWLILAFTGAGRRPSDWFDRVCFLFGLLWIAWYLGGDSILTLHWTW
jgi:hypothetical protein